MIIGGYGGFGARLSRRLVAAGHRVIVAGRSAEKGAAFCAGLANAEPVVANRTRGIGLVMARLRPDLVIDAAGPFQSGGHIVPEACIAMRIPYLDLADARDFVTGIGALDTAARRAGVPIIAGASSVPALSGAVARHLAAGLERIDAVEIAISASNRSSAGVSVAKAILSYVGRPIRLWRGRRWAAGFGWQEMRHADFLLADGHGIKGRLVALADVPDLDLMPAALPGRPAVTFRAGTELGFQMIALWLASWPVRWGWMRSLTRNAAWLLPLYRMTLGLGGARSAMRVEVKGDGCARCWTLVADKGEGLEVPTMAAALLAGRVLAGGMAPGAYDASGLLDLADFEPLFATLAIRHAIAEHAVPPLYARIMGERFAALPPVVRAIHRVNGDGGATGEGRVERGTGMIARLIGWVMRFPPTGDYPLHVAFAERDGVEHWTRDFGGHHFASCLAQDGDCVTERFGPLRFVFALPSDRAGLRMVLRRWSAFGIRLPRMLAPRIEAREWAEDGRFHLMVDIRMPLIGPIVRYTGWLWPAA
nr:SDR family oxidoreductase [Sphingomonas colocasiae]